MVRVCVSAVLVVRPRLLVLSVASGGSLESYGAVPEAILGRIAVAVSGVKGAVMCISRVVPIFSLEDCEGVKLLMEYEDNAQRYVCVCVCVREREAQSHALLLLLVPCRHQAVQYPGQLTRPCQAVRLRSQRAGTCTHSTSEVYW